MDTCQMTEGSTQSFMTINAVDGTIKEHLYLYTSRLKLNEDRKNGKYPVRLKVQGETAAASYKQGRIMNYPL